MKKYNRIISDDDDFESDLMIAWWLIGFYGLKYVI
jgi:hypothetical protein